MIAAVLGTRWHVVKTQGNLNNEIGCPLSLLRIDEEADVAVIEMGANHAGEIARLCELARPTESAITMVGPAHLEGFGSVENVAKAKAEIVACLPRNGTFYVNADNEWCVRIAETFAGKTVLFGRRGDVALKECAFDASGMLCLRVEPVGELRLPLACRAHAGNVLLAIAVGLQHGVTAFQEPLFEACEAMARFKIAQAGPLEIIDDSYNANPSSVAAALEALMERPGTGKRLAALGEMLELGEAAGDLHHKSGRLAGELGVTHLFALGPHAHDTVAGAKASGVPHAEAMDECATIAKTLHALARPGDVLLVKGSRGMRMERVIEALRKRMKDEG